MMFCLSVAVLQFGAAVQFGLQGQILKSALMGLYGLTNIVLAFMKEAN